MRVAGLQQPQCWLHLRAGQGTLSQRPGNQRQCGRGGLHTVHQRFKSRRWRAFLQVQARPLQPWPGRLGRGGCGLLKKCVCVGVLVCGKLCGCLLAQVMGKAVLEVSLPGLGQLGGGLCRLYPIAAAFVVGQEGEPGLGFEGRVLQLLQGLLRPVNQAGLEVVQRQRMLRPLSIQQA